MAQFFRYKEEVVDDIFGLAREHLAKFGVLRGDAHGAGVQVALAQHNAAHSDERRGSHPELFGAQQACDCHVPSRLELPVRLHHDAPAQIVEHQNLLRFG